MRWACKVNYVRPKRKLAGVFSFRAAAQRQALPAPIPQVSDGPKRVADAECWRIFSGSAYAAYGCGLDVLPPPPINERADVCRRNGIVLGNLKVMFAALCALANCQNVRLG